MALISSKRLHFYILTSLWLYLILHSQLKHKKHLYEPANWSIFHIWMHISSISFSLYSLVVNHLMNPPYHIKWEIIIEILFISCSVVIFNFFTSYLTCIHILKSSIYFKFYWPICAHLVWIGFLFLIKYALLR